MAAAIVDLNVNENETFEMTMTYWEDADKTLPVDLTDWTFEGAFNFKNLCIPMTFTKDANSVLARVEASDMNNLPIKGSYSIEASDTTSTFRVQQGKVRVDKEKVC